jgi:hypothetical protein
MKYIAIVKSEIEAEQFIPPLQIPKGVINVYEMGKGTSDDPHLVYWRSMDNTR